jgi:hypothetical protein
VSYIVIKLYQFTIKLKISALWWLVFLIYIREVPGSTDVLESDMYTRILSHVI